MLSFAEVEFIAEKCPIEIVPNFTHRKLNLISGDIGPISASFPVSVPIWLGIFLKQMQKCRIVTPDWMDVSVLEEKRQEETDCPNFTKLPSKHFFETVQILMSRAIGDVPRADEIRTLAKDIFDIRTAKLRNSVEAFIRSDSLHAQLDFLTIMEVNLIRQFMIKSLDHVGKLRENITGSHAGGSQASNVSGSRGGTDDTVNESSDDSTLESEESTSAELMILLENAWTNEKLSPDLLKHKTDVVDTMMELIAVMEGNLQRNVGRDSFLIGVHKMEIDRIKFVIGSYLSCRLKKLERYPIYALQECGSYISEEEMKYLKEFVKGLQDHLQQLVLQHLHPSMRVFNLGEAMPVPELNNFVFVKMNEDVNGLEVVDDSVEGSREVINPKKDAQLAICYKFVAELIKNGKASLT